jgi:hypothetical protein
MKTFKVGGSYKVENKVYWVCRYSATVFKLLYIKGV